MIDLLHVYDCPKCGQILEDWVDTTTLINHDTEEVVTVTYCTRCDSDVRQKMGVGSDGKPIPVLQEVDHERWLWAIGHYDESSDEDDENYVSYGDPFDDEPFDEW